LNIVNILLFGQRIKSIKRSPHNRLWLSRYLVAWFLCCFACQFLSSGATFQIGPRPPPVWMFLDHTQTHTTLRRTSLDEWSVRRRDLYLTTHKHSQEISIHAPGGIRTPDLSRRSAEGPGVRLRGHWARPSVSVACVILRVWRLYLFIYLFIYLFAFPRWRTECISSGCGVYLKFLCSPNVYPCCFSFEKLQCFAKLLWSFNRW
jgi:hypothetical protein